MLILQNVWDPYHESFIINRGYVMNIRRARSLTELATALYTRTRAHSAASNAHIYRIVRAHVQHPIGHMNTHMHVTCQLTNRSFRISLIGLSQ